MVTVGAEEDLILDGYAAKRTQCYKNLHMNMTGTGRNEDDISTKTSPGRSIIKQINDILQNMHIKNSTKILIYQATIEGKTGNQLTKSRIGGNAVD